MMVAHTVGRGVPRQSIEDKPRLAAAYIPPIGRALTLLEHAAAAVDPA